MARSTPLQNAVGLVFLAAFFSGFVWLIGSSHRRSMDQLQAAIAVEEAAGKTTLGPITVHHSACHPLQKGGVSRFFTRLVCPSCHRDGLAIQARYEVSFLEGRCSPRGTNTVALTRRDAGRRE